MTLIVAHRGYRDQFAENTFAAFQGALEVGADVIETDLQLTLEGSIVLNHDQETGRTYNENLIISENTVSRLKQLVNKQDETQKIVTFNELLDWVKDKEIKLMLDIKPYNDVSILAKVIRSLRDIKPIDFWYDKIEFGIWSLQFYDFANITNLLSGFKVVNISISPTVSMSFIKKSLNGNLKLDAVSLLNVSLLSKEFNSINKVLIENNIKLYVWTSNSIEFWKNAYQFNPYGIITDKPLDLKNFIKSKDFKFIYPQCFTKSWLELNLRFGFYRFFEFIQLSGLLSYAPIRIFMRSLIKLLAG